MKQWIRAAVVMLCGGCGREVKKGAPLFEITFGPQMPKTGDAMVGAERPSNWTRTKHRCETCVGESAPAELPSLPEHPAIQPTRVLPPQFASMRGLARDWKQIQSGEDR